MALCCICKSKSTNPGPITITTSTTKLIPGCILDIDDDYNLLIVVSGDDIGESDNVIKIKLKLIGIELPRSNEHMDIKTREKLISVSKKVQSHILDLFQVINMVYVTIENKIADNLYLGDIKLYAYMLTEYLLKIEFAMPTSSDIYIWNDDQLSKILEYM